MAFFPLFPLLSFLSLDEKGDIAGILQHVALENVRAGTQDAFEPSAVQFDALQRTSGSHGGSSGPVEQQSDFSEVLGRPEAADFHRVATLVADLRGTKPTRLE